MMTNLLSQFAQLTVDLPTPSADQGHIQTIINLVLGIAGAAALLVMTMAGFRYVTSRGSANDVSQAKDAILYSLIGLVVIISAYTIVNFVIFKVK